TVCSIVLLRKSSGSLDLLTEARVVQRYPRLRADLQALYAGYYVAELLDELTEENDPHPLLFEETLTTLEALGKPGVETGTRLARWELGLLRELGYCPALEECGVCAAPVTGDSVAFSPSAGGVLCPACPGGARDRRVLGSGAWQFLRALREPGDAWCQPWDADVRAEVRQVLGQYVTYLLGH